MKPVCRCVQFDTTPQTTWEEPCEQLRIGVRDVPSSPCLRIFEPSSMASSSQPKVVYCSNFSTLLEIEEPKTSSRELTRTRSKGAQSVKEATSSEPPFWSAIGLHGFAQVTNVSVRQGSVGTGTEMFCQNLGFCSVLRLNLCRSHIVSND